MKRKHLMYRILSILLIVVTLVTSQSLVVLGETVSNSQSEPKKTGNQNKIQKPKPVQEKIKTKKSSHLPYGVLKNEKVLEKWTNKKEEIASRTSNSKTYLNEDGSKTTLIFFEPIHVKANNKNKNKVNTGKNNLKQSDYLEINNELTPITSGKVDGYVNTLGIYDVSFIDEKINLLKDSVELSITPNNINWEGMETEENQVFLPSYEDGITYVYSVNNASVKEDIVLNYYKENIRYSYDIIVDKKYDVFLENNTLYITSNNRKEVYYMLSAPYMMDREGNVNFNLTLSLEKRKNVYRLYLTVDEEWLKDSTRAYPVTIDPTIHISGAASFRDTYVEENQPNTTQFSREIMYIGYDDGVESGNGAYAEGLTKGYIKFQLPDEIENSNIESASLTMYQSTSWSNEPRSIEIKRPLSNVTIPIGSAPNYAECVTYNTQPSLGETIARTTITTSGSYSWDIKSIVKDWAEGAANNGLALQMANNRAQAEVFHTTEGNNKPYVEITYNSMPEPEPVSEELTLVLEREDIYQTGTAYVKSLLEWNPNVDNGTDLGEQNDKFNKVTINMP